LPRPENGRGWGKKKKERMGAETDELPPREKKSKPVGANALTSNKKIQVRATIKNQEKRTGGAGKGVRARGRTSRGPANPTKSIIWGWNGRKSAEGAPSGKK